MEAKIEQRNRCRAEDAPRGIGKQTVEYFAPLDTDWNRDRPFGSRKAVDPMIQHPHHGHRSSIVEAIGSEVKEWPDENGLRATNAPEDWIPQAAGQQRNNLHTTIRDKPS